MITGINHITLSVTDLERSIDFYVGILKFRQVHRWNDGVYLEAGSLWLCLSLCESVGLRKDYSHLAFTVSSEDIDSLATKSEELGLLCWKENKSEGNSFYLLDPDGHKLELHDGSLLTRMAHIMSQTPMKRSRGCDA
ncbi:MAG: VOC family protein [Cyanobacteria bacterium P01_F01_bin.13]